MLEHQLQVAISQGKTKWLQELLAKKLPEFYSEDVDYGTWFDSVIEHMEKRGLNEPKKQKNFLTDIRNAIKILDPNHAALEIVKFDTLKISFRAATIKTIFTLIFFGLCMPQLLLIGFAHLLFPHRNIEQLSKDTTKFSMKRILN